MHKPRVGLLLLLSACPFRASAGGTFNVINSNDSGTGSLRQAILSANAVGGGTINISGGLITLQSPLPILSTPITLNGSGAQISGNDQYRVFFVDAPTGSLVAFNDLSIVSGRAKGGDGGVGGGGGLGAGGGVFLNSGNLTLSNVNLLANAATGGAGAGGNVGGTGGGGGLGGNGGNIYGGGGGYQGNGGSSIGGGGGLDTAGANSVGAGGGEGGTGPLHGGGNAYVGPPGAGGGGGTLASPAANASASGGSNGGKFGGGGGAGIKDNGNGQIPQAGSGGNGGEFGGGGASGSQGGNGGFGGGGGFGYIVGGNGGFGGGAGGWGVTSTAVAGAFGGSSISLGPSGPNFGGGGAALGGHVFVRGGASLTLIDTGTDFGTLTPGQAGPLGTTASGQVAGSAFFLSGTTNFAVTAGNSRIIRGSISDAGPYLNTPKAPDFSAGLLVKSGQGTLELGAINTYTGGTIISQGTLIADSKDALGTGTVTFNDGNTGTSDATLNLLGGGVVNNSILVSTFGSGKSTLASDVQVASPFNLTGAMTLNHGFTFIGQTAYPQDAAHNVAQNRLSGAITGIGDLTISGGHLTQFSTNAKTYTGRTIVTGNTTLSLNDVASAPINSIVQVEVGSSLIIEGLANNGGVTIGGLTGAGLVANNANRGAVSGLTLANTTGGTHTFTGTLGHGIILYKTGNDTLALGAQNDAGVQLYVLSGTLRLLGDQRVGAFAIQKTSAGTQAADLNGHTVRDVVVGLGYSGLRNAVRKSIGDASDGIYDSTASARDAVGYKLLPAESAAMIKLTRRGDADLDGTVNFSDLVTVAQHYGAGSGTYWEDGDFNYDGAVNFTDLVAIAQNYGSAFPSAPIPGAPVDFNTDLAAAFASVPEPSALTLAGICGFVFLKRRRDQRRFHLTVVKQK